MKKEIEEDTVAEMVPARNVEKKNATIDKRRESLASKLINELTLNQLPEEVKAEADKHVSYR